MTAPQESILGITKAYGQNAVAFIKGSKTLLEAMASLDVLLSCGLAALARKGPVYIDYEAQTSSLLGSNFMT